MRKALIPAFLLVVTAIVLGSTVFREQVVSAATTPFQNVVVTNTSTNPIPVTQVGTSTTSVSGTVGIDPSKNTVKLDSGGNTVKLDSNGNTVNLDSTDAANLANVESKLANLNFDSGGNLETAAQTASSSPRKGRSDEGTAAAAPAVVTIAIVLRSARGTDDVYATDIPDPNGRLISWPVTTSTSSSTSGTVDGSGRTRTSSISPIPSTSTRSTGRRATTARRHSTSTSDVLGNSTGN